MRKVLSFALFSLCLLGAGCSMQGVAEKDSIQKDAEVDYFNKKVECNEHRNAVEDRISKHITWADTRFYHMCYSKKYNSCVIQYSTSLKTGTLKELQDSTVTYFEDALTGRVLHTVNENEGATSANAFYKATNDIDCVK